MLMATARLLLVCTRRCCGSVDGAVAVGVGVVKKRQAMATDPSSADESCIS